MDYKLINLFIFAIVVPLVQAPLYSKCEVSQNGKGSTELTCNLPLGWKVLSVQRRNGTKWADVADCQLLVDRLDCQVYVSENLTWDHTERSASFNLTDSTADSQGDHTYICQVPEYPSEECTIPSVPSSTTSVSTPTPSAHSDSTEPSSTTSKTGPSDESTKSSTSAALIATLGVLNVLLLILSIVLGRKLYLKRKKENGTVKDIEKATEGNPDSSENNPSPHDGIATQELLSVEKGKPKEENGKLEVNYGKLEDKKNLEEENGKLKEENRKLKVENGKLKEENEKLKEENGKLKEENTTLKELNKTSQLKMPQLETDTSSIHKSKPSAAPTTSEQSPKTSVSCTEVQPERKALSAQAENFYPGYSVSDTGPQLRKSNIADTKPGSRIVPGGNERSEDSRSGTASPRASGDMYSSSQAAMPGITRSKSPKQPASSVDCAMHFEVKKFSEEVSKSESGRGGRPPLQPKPGKPENIAFPLVKRET